MEATEVIRQMIVKELRFTGAPSMLTDDYGLLEADVLDSQGIFRLIGLLEERYGIEFEGEDIVSENFETISAVAALVAAKVS